MPSPTDHPGGQAAVKMTLTATILTGAVAESRRPASAPGRPVGRAPAGFTGLADQVRLPVAGSGAARTGPTGRSAISIKTVEANLTRVYRKLGLRGRVDLARRGPG